MVSFIGWFMEAVWFVGLVVLVVADFEFFAWCCVLMGYYTCGLGLI